MNKRYKGHKIVRSLDTEVKRVAEERYGKICSEVIEGSYFEKRRAASITFGELWEKYRDKYKRSRDNTSVKHLLPVFGSLTLDRITSEKVENYILDRAEYGAAPATIYQEFSIGRRLFNIARRRWKLTTQNPFADLTFSELLTIDNKRSRYLHPDEEIILLQNATPSYLRDIIVFALHTGCRRGEILSARWKENVNFQQRFVRVPISKLRPGEETKYKVIPMTDTLYQMLQRLSRVPHISGLIFPYKMTAVKDAFERAVRKSGIKDFRFHDLRHTFSTRLVQEGVDLYRVSKMLGHRTLKMTERYAHHSPESLSFCIKALENVYKNITVEDERVAQ